VWLSAAKNVRFLDVFGGVPLLKPDPILSVLRDCASRENALRDTPECFARRVPLGIVFCDPNIAMVGQRFKDLDQDQVVVGEVDLKGQGRLRMEGADRGLIRLYADIRRGSLLGVELCCPHGEHLAHLLALAIQQGLTVRELLRMPFYHPVVEEGLRSALRDAAGKLSDDPTPDLARCGRLGAEALE
jgi:dihydrolipoamide dehydrogenase